MDNTSSHPSSRSARVKKPKVIFEQVHSVNPDLSAHRKKAYASSIKRKLTPFIPSVVQNTTKRVKKSLQKHIIKPLNETVSSLSNALASSIVSNEHFSSETSATINHLQSTIKELHYHNSSLALSYSVIQADNIQLHNNNVNLSQSVHEQSVALEMNNNNIREMATSLTQVSNIATSKKQSNKETLEKKSFYS